MLSPQDPSPASVANTPPSPENDSEDGVEDVHIQDDEGTTSSKGDPAPAPVKVVCKRKRTESERNLALEAEVERLKEANKKLRHSYSAKKAKLSDYKKTANSTFADLRKREKASLKEATGKRKLEVDSHKLTVQARDATRELTSATASLIVHKRCIEQIRKAIAPNIASLSYDPSIDELPSIIEGIAKRARTAAPELARLRQKVKDLESAESLF